MKLSIQAVFKHILLFLGLIFILLTLVGWAEIERYFTFDKLHQLNTVESLANKISLLDKKRDITYTKIQLDGLQTELQQQTDILKFSIQNSLLVEIFSNKETLLRKIDNLQHFNTLLKENALKYLETKNQNLHASQRKLEHSRLQVIEQTGLLKTQIIAFEYAFFIKTQWILYAALLLTLIIIIRYKKLFRLIYEDIESLYGINTNKQTVSATQEIETIKARILRKPSVTENSSLIDPISGIKNEKGMFHAYTYKKKLKEANYTTVCIFEIDNLEQYTRYPKEFLQTVFKKIASMISLYEQNTDVVARTDYNRFVLILSRETKNKAYEECKAIQESIKETVFKTPDNQKIQLTLSGGFDIKLKSQSLEEALKHIQKLLYIAKDKGGDRIVQMKEYAERF
jgi:diguanylate cyclase (GGDEF)-like protein